MSRKVNTYKWIGWSGMMGSLPVPLLLIGLAEFLGCVILLPSFSQAQVLPSGNSPSRIEQQIPPPSLPQPTHEINVSPREDLAPPENASKQTFFLSSVQVSGATVFSAERLQSLYAEFLNRKISLADLYTIANRLTQFYRSKGYLLSRAIVPAQAIQVGVAQIQVVEGYVEKVEFTDAPPILQKRLNAYGTRIVASHPLNKRDLERYLLLINDLPGIQVRAVLRPGSSRGSAILDGQVSYRPLNLFLDLNNRGTDEVGSVRLQAGAFVNSPLGLGERWIIRGATTPEDVSELAFGAGSLAVPLGREGLVAELSGSFTTVHPGGSLRKFDLNGKSAEIGLALNYPLVRSRRQNLYLSGRFDIENSVNSTAFIGESLTLSDDRLRVLRLALRYDAIDRSGKTSVVAQISQGLNLLDASTEGTPTRPLSRASGSADFTKANIELTRQQYLPAGFSFLFAATGQVTGDSLLVPEQLGLGGETFGSAFDPALILGDQGYGLRAELQRSIGYRAKELHMITQPYLFADYGQVFRQSPTAVENAQDSLASTGFGVRQGIGKVLFLNLELAFPIERTDSSFSNTPRLFFRAQGVF